MHSAIPNSVKALRRQPEKCPKIWVVSNSISYAVDQVLERVGGALGHLGKLEVGDGYLGIPLPQPHQTPKSLVLYLRVAPVCFEQLAATTAPTARGRGSRGLAW
jgi:hypothetical protein